MGDARRWLRAYVARYALGRDYHKLMRTACSAGGSHRRAGRPFGYRVFVDSAPVLERALARNAGPWLDWQEHLPDQQGRRQLVLPWRNLRRLPLAGRHAGSAHCGTCTRCIDICPTQAIVAPNRIDARRCISYLTIELKGSIPEEFRTTIGNRIFGCDDCQLVCPWNKFAKRHDEPDFRARNNLDQATPGRAVRLDAKRNSSSAPKARRSAAPDTWDGRAISQLRWEMRRIRMPSSLHCRPVSTIPRRWCANTSSGHCSVIGPRPARAVPI